MNISIHSDDIDEKVCGADVPCYNSQRICRGRFPTSVILYSVKTSSQRSVPLCFLVLCIAPLFFYVVGQASCQQNV